MNVYLCRGCEVAGIGDAAARCWCCGAPLADPAVLSVPANTDPRATLLSLTFATGHFLRLVAEPTPVRAT